ncbi:MAG: peptidase U62 [Thaumarchaeota archaeon]|nr:peptidase U62 [Nitrososphaerota archaeon]
MQDICKKALDIALKFNVDEAESFLVDKEIITIRVADSQIAESKGIRERGLAIRIVKNGSIGASSTSLLDEKNLANAVEDAILATTMGSEIKWKSFPKPSKITSVDGCYDERLNKLSIEKCIDISLSMLNSTLQFSNVNSVSGSLHVVKEHVYITNSNNVNLHDNGTYIIGNINADAKNNGETVSGVGFNTARTLNAFNAESVGKEAGDMATRSIGARNCDEGTLSVIFTPYALGELLSFVLSYNFNAKAYQDKRSCLYGKLGKQVAVETFTLQDNPRSRDCIGSKSFDDEGVPTQTRNLIEKGVFQSIIYDTFYAAKDNVDSTGNASRSGYPVGRSANPIPFPSMHNIVIKSGDYSIDEIIRETKNGLLVGRLWYTYAVNPEKGDFSCTARSGIFIIKNGEIVGPSRMVRIIDNLQRFLMNITAIGKDSKHTMQWHSLPSVTPSLRVDGIKVVPV